MIDVDSITIQQAYERNKDIVDPYFKKNAKKLNKMIDKILFKLRFDVEKSDFYSLGNEIFLDALCRYDGTIDFNGFLYSCLVKKFKSEMTKRNRQKRKCDKDSVSIDTPIGDENGGFIIADILKSNINIEEDFFNSNELYSEKMKLYLNRLSCMQKQVLHLISIDLSQNEILEELHINKKTYDNCLAAIHSYRNISILL